MAFVHCHRHSAWSILDGTGTGTQYAERAAELGQSALALTDHGTLAGVLDHMTACHSAGIIPVIGCEVYFRENRLLHSKENAKKFHLTLLAMNYQGWLSLMRMVSKAWGDGFYSRPCVDWDLLERHHQGIYALGGCIGSRLSNLIQVGYEQDVANYVKRMRSIFGERFSLEIMPHDFDDQRRLNADTLSVANDYSIPLVATCDAHYPFKEWAGTQDVMLMLATRQSNSKRDEKIKKKQEAQALDPESGEDIKIYTMLQENPTLYLMSEEELMGAFLQYHPRLAIDVTDSAIAHSVEIVSMCSPFMFNRDIKMPKITSSIISKIDEDRPKSSFVDPDWQVAATFRRWCQEGLEFLKRLYPPGHWDTYPLARYQEQIEHEFGTFSQIGPHVLRYLFMVAGEVRWARRNGIIVGPARGSAAGSLCAYLSGITEIDPIPYGLMFERFINPSRKGMPDIDVDFMPGATGRDRVKAHTAEVYGAENVIDIAAYGTHGPKSALNAVCRVFDRENEIKPGSSGHLLKVLDQLKPTDKLDLEQCAERFPEIAEFRRLYPEPWKHALRIEGHPYSQSVHASGVLIKPVEIEIPIASRGDGDKRVAVTAWPDTRELLAAYGFLKIDYLVIDGLVRQHDVIAKLKERDGIDFDLSHLPVRWDPYAVDPEVMECFTRGRTLGVWQMDGKGTAPVLKEVKPTNLHDLAAINALIRPGPRGAGMIEEYAKRKHGQIPITYWHEVLEPVLKLTYGLMLYQEQAMEIVVLLAGFSRAEADDLRKAMGKKYREGMAAVKKFLRELGFYEKFIDNAAKIVGRKLAEKIWDAILSFGAYSFNQSHAYGYGLISYQDMLLKKVTPADFYAELLTHTKSNEMVMRLQAVMREGADTNITIKPPDINLSGLGFKAIDRTTILYGLEGVKHLGPAGVKAVFQNRPYRSFAEFTERIAPREVNTRARKALINAGAFDCFDLRRMMTPTERAYWENEFMGVRLSGDRDIDTYAAVIEETIHSEAEFDEAPDGARLCVGGEIVAVKETVTKKGDAMGFVNVAYGPDSYRVTVFPPVWAMYSTLFKQGDVVFFEGKKQIDSKYGAGFIADDVITLGALVKLRNVGAPR